MDIISIIALSIFSIGYVLITLEHKLNTNKAAIGLALGAILWLIASITAESSDEIVHAVHDAGAEIFQIVIFLLAAMTLVEILVHYRFFDIIRTKLASFKLNDKKQFIVIGILTFFLSAILDNLTITIVMTQISKQFFKGKNLLVVVAGIVILANAGGAWSPIGDVTTIILWLADKFTATEIILHTFIPAAVIGLVSGYFLYRQVNNSELDLIIDKNIILEKSEKMIIGMALISFSFPIFMNFLNLPPYLGLLFGLGIVWGLIEFLKHRTKTESHLNASIEALLQKTDISSLNFFIGILLAVSALGSLGILENLSNMIFGPEQDPLRVAGGAVLLGLLSAIVDNVPLTAISLDLIKITDTYIWTFLALMVGTGGSALIIGSAAGVVAMGMVKELNFMKYLRIGTFPALIGYFAGIIVYAFEYFFLH